VWQIDAGTLERLRRLALPEVLRPWAVAVGGGSVWASEGSPGSVSRFNAQTGKFQQRYLHAGRGYSAKIAFGDGAAWTAANAPGELLRVDAVLAGQQSIQIGRVPYDVVVAFDAVWVSDFVEAPTSPGRVGPGKILRLDPDTGLVDDVIDVGRRPVAVATGGGSVWVANSGDRTISEIDPRTNQVVNTIHTRYYPQDVEYGHGFLWVPLSSTPFTF
jgi:YVTN family beta-propeller protein